LRINERNLRNLQKQRHMYEIQNMVLTNPLFKNLSPKEQKTLQKLIYKAEMAEMYVRDRNIIRTNDSFDELVESVAMLLNDLTEEDDKRLDGDDEKD
jgi:TRAP-type C4-dicarboxylate transport system substrate-binding protein